MLDEKHCNKLCSKPTKGSCNLCTAQDEADQFCKRWFRGGFLCEILVWTLNGVGKASIWFFRPFRDSFRVIELAGIFATIAALSIAIYALLVDIGMRQEEREARAWQLLTTRAAGSGGKIWALEYLNSWGPCPFQGRRLFLKEESQRPLFLPQLPTKRWSWRNSTTVSLRKLYSAWNWRDFLKTSQGWREFFKEGLRLERIDLSPLIGIPDQKAEAKHPCILQELNHWLFSCSPSWWPSRKQPIALEEIDLEPPAVAEQGLPDGDCVETTNLQGVNLGCANLEGATLACSNLQNADLREANLQHIDLRKTDLRGANLNGANLEEADLRGAELGEEVRLKDPDISEESKKRRACRQLEQAFNWEKAYRDVYLECGEDIPLPKIEEQ